MLSYCSLLHVQFDIGPSVGEVLDWDYFVVGVAEVPAEAEEEDEASPLPEDDSAATNCTAPEPQPDDGQQQQQQPPLNATDTPVPRANCTQTPLNDTQAALNATKSTTVKVCCRVSLSLSSCLLASSRPWVVFPAGHILPRPARPCVQRDRWQLLSGAARPGAQLGPRIPRFQHHQRGGGSFRRFFVLVLILFHSGLFRVAFLSCRHALDWLFVIRSLNAFSACYSCSPFHLLGGPLSSRRAEPGHWRVLCGVAP